MSVPGVTTFELPPSLHPQETVLGVYGWEGGKAVLVQWERSHWCGKLRYASTNRDQPDMDKLYEEFYALAEADLSPNEPEAGWHAVLCFNAFTDRWPSGTFIGFLTSSSDQPEGFDQVWVEQGQYLRVELNEENQGGFHALLADAPPQDLSQTMAALAQKLGFPLRTAKLPFAEYFQYGADGTPLGCWLYVPVLKNKRAEG